ncbi:hypothetical protein ACQP2U_23370 [Nocardia sp. CA-084685]|uniref:hypothetical protein n=1 Tax=Nocardia sp. CA-084685 TaxID=3239970 RepID=UPI003D974ADA
MKALRLRTGITMVAAALAMIASSAGLLTATPAVVRADPATPIADDLAPLQEFRTSGDAGWFYTLKAAEAENAVNQNKFTKSADIGYLHTTEGTGRTAVHRLRVKDNGPSYMLSVSANEIGDPRFVDEGIIGYVDGSKQTGETNLLRFSNHGKWRVLADGPDNVKNMQAAGYDVDGPIGWFKP